MAKTGAHHVRTHADRAGGEVVTAMPSDHGIAAHAAANGTSGNTCCRWLRFTPVAMTSRDMISSTVVPMTPS
jgi:hypothetical protein